MEDYGSSNGPELVFGLVGPIGTDMDCVVDELKNSLRSVGYDPHLVHITALLPQMLKSSHIKAGSLSEKINLANQLRSETGDESILATIAFARIREIRGEINIARGANVINSEISLSDVPAPNVAYIVRQLKRDEEVQLFRKVYGNCYIQVSVAVDESKQLEDVIRIVARQEPKLNASDREEKARGLIGTDRQELSNDFGQRMAEAYQSADFFVAGNTQADIGRSINRFIRALFGANNIGPTRDEYGAMLAKTASLRSVDLSRQVGAALLNDAGDVISLGCNEVPAAGGGQYWADSLIPSRDIDIGIDPNKIETSGVIEGYLELLSKVGALRDNYLDVLASRDYLRGLKDSAISDITEFGRITHAEMSAITEAARLGRPLQNTTLYVTTFPCHNCAKHIIASGVARIVYIEPYAKSRALQLHQDALTTNRMISGKVLVEHFQGIAPRRFRKIFEKGRRKNKSTHTAEVWYEGRPVALFTERSSLHTHKEMLEVKRAFAGLQGGEET
jgi:deoxycytidylate deaminase